MLNNFDKLQSQETQGSKQRTEQVNMEFTQYPTLAFVLSHLIHT